MDDYLKKLIINAYNNSPFYKVFYNDLIDMKKIDQMEFSEIPIVKKNDIYESTIRMISEKYYDEFVQHKLVKYSTSGSTGLCLDVFWSQLDINKSLSRLWYLRKKYYGISPEDKCCTFYSNMKINNYEPQYIEYDNLLSFSKSNLDNKRFNDMYNLMYKFQPKYMIIEPNIALLFCKYIKKNNLERISSLKYIEFTGEYLSNEIKTKINNEFACVSSNQYGAYEVNSIAYECPEGNMHCMQQNVYVEILDDNGKQACDNHEGNIYVTSLTNSAMPFIRYKIGDKGKFSKKIKCKCGNLSPIIEITKGRCNDVILCKDGSEIHSSVFVKAIENTNELLKNPIDPIVQYQIHQVNYDEFIIDCVLSEEVIDIEQVSNTFATCVDEERLKGSKIMFKIYEEIFPDNNSGKLKYFINDMISR